MDKVTEPSKEVSTEPASKKAESVEKVASAAPAVEKTESVEKVASAAPVAEKTESAEKVASAAPVAEKTESVEKEASAAPVAEKTESAEKEAPVAEKEASVAPKNTAIKSPPSYKKAENMENVQSLLGIKLGMTQVFSDNGDCLPVTLVKLGPVEVLRKKTMDKDGYEALQVGFEELSENKRKKLPKAQQKQMQSRAYRYVQEVRINALEKYQVGDFFDINAFQVGEIVNVTGVSKGKGFAGVMKRHNFSGGPKSHGSHFKRAPGSIGASAYPARVFKNRKMPGHYGFSQVTVKNLQIVEIQKENSLLVLKGAIPGATGRLVEVCRSSKT